MIGSRGTRILVIQSTLGSMTWSQRRGTEFVQINLFGEPRVGMAETICKRVWEHRARQKEHVEEISSSSESKEDLVPDSSSNSEREYK